MGSTSSGWKGATAAIPPARRGTAPSAPSQACVTAIRAAGATTTIHVPGNGHTAAASWTADCYDAGLPRRSTAEGWLDAGGEGSPLSDPLDRSVAEVPVYLDADGSGSTTAITTPPVGRDGLAIAMTEAAAAAHGYRLVVGEMGCYAANPLAPAAWAHSVSYTAASAAICAGDAWWAAGNPGWWTTSALTAAALIAAGFT